MRLSSLTAKYVMAVTGAGLVVFVLGHLAGNLTVFLGPDWLNGYAHHLKELPALVWTARVGLLVFFVVHVLVGVRLSLLNNGARPVGYQYDDVRVTSWASRYMLATGVVVLLFLLYHLAHFTFGWVKEAHVGGAYYHYHKLHDAQGRHDVYTMVVAGFRDPMVAALYLASMVALWLHLWHGASSLFQSVGLGTVSKRSWTSWVGPVVATVVLVGNSAIVLGVQVGLIGGGMR